MGVIGHQDISASGNIELLVRSAAKHPKCMMNFWSGQDRHSHRCVKRYEVEWPELCEQMFETEWPSVEPII
jgi:hypothetical protein